MKERYGWHLFWLDEKETRKLLNYCKKHKIKLKEKTKNNIKMGQYGRHPYPHIYQQILRNVYEKIK